MTNLQTLVNISTATVTSNVIHQYDENVPYHTSVDVKTTGVYNLFEGVVWEISNEPGNLYYICVKSSNNCIIKYGHLESVSFDVYGRIRPGELIGTAKKYTTIEYLTLKSSMFPTYVNGDKYYKNDPTDIIINDISPSIKANDATYKQTSDTPVVLMGGLEPTYN